MPNAVDELRERNRATWSAGEWDEVAELVREVGPHRPAARRGVPLHRLK